MTREMNATREQLIAAWHDHQNENEDLREQVSDHLAELERLRDLVDQQDGGARVDALKVLGRIAVYAQRQAEHHEGDGMAGLARPWWHVVALATGEDGDVVEGRPDGAATGDDDE